MSRVTYSLENTVAIWTMPAIAEEMSKFLKAMPFEVVNCEDAIDACMIPHFCLVLDGQMLRKDDQYIESLECYLTGFAGRMEKCRRCRNLTGCDVDVLDGIDTEPDYKVPVVLLYPEKRERDVEGLVAVVPPMVQTEPFSAELQQWIIKTVWNFHRKALLWRNEFEKWITVDELREFKRSKTATEIAERRWLPRRMVFELKFPDYY